MLGLQEYILSLGGSILGSRGPVQARESPLESEVGEKRLPFIFERGPSQPGGPLVANFIPVTRALAAPLGRSLQSKR